MNTFGAQADEDAFYREAFSRNIGFLSEDEQRRLRQSTVAIAGLGGVGGNYCLSLARLGVGSFIIADNDSFETVNTNRQAGATTSTIGLAKSAVMERMIKDINPFAHVRVFPEGINDDNLDAFLVGAQVVIDGLDFFVIRERLALFRRAREKGIFSITSGPIGFGAALLVFDPKGMSFERYFDIRKGMGEDATLFQFALGLTPSFIQWRYFRPTSIDFSGKKAPSLGIGTQLCSVMVTCEVSKLLLGKSVRTIPRSTHFDPYVQKYRKIFLPWGNRNPRQWLVKLIIRRMMRVKRAV